MLIATEKLTNRKLSQYNFKLHRAKLRDKLDKDIAKEIRDGGIDLNEALKGKTQYANTSYVKTIKRKKSDYDIYIEVSYQTKRLFINYRGVKIPIPNDLFNMIKEELFQTTDTD